MKDAISINAAPANPGQFFACCGLLELADRLWSDAEAWFKNREFHIRCASTESKSLVDLVRAISIAEVSQIDRTNDTSSPLEIGDPFLGLRLDWWQNEQTVGREMKVWAGSMDSTRIARAMQRAMSNAECQTADILNFGIVVYDPDEPDKKVEPFYFDARRGPNAHSRDVGFSPNTLQLTTIAFPAVEFLCLVGLQRCLPSKVANGRARLFDYFTWDIPAPPLLLPALACGELRSAGSRGYRFETWYRTGQRKHKAFLPATAHTV
jgi:CRISPR-associated protein Csb3